MTKYTRVAVETDTANRMSINAYEANDSGHGYRLAGRKYDGTGSRVVVADLSQRDADEIRKYLDLVFPITAPDNAAAAGSSHEEAQKALDIRAHTTAGYLYITDCPDCSQLVQVDRRSGKFTGHNISPLLRAVCPGSGRLASALSEETGK